MRIKHSIVNRGHNFTLDKRDHESLNVQRRIATNDRAVRDLLAFREAVAKGERSPRVREDSSTAVVMKHAIRTMRKHNASRVRSTGPMSKQTSRGLDSL